MRARTGSVTDWQLVALAAVLSVFGVAMVYSAGQVESTRALEDHWKVQIGWIAVGATVAYAINRVSPQFLEWVAVPGYVLSIVLLLALKLGLGSGAGTAGSTESWLTIGGRRIGQPSELAKIATVFMLAKVLAGRRDTAATLFDLLKPMAVIAVPWVLIMAQPDLGTGMVLVGVFFAMLFWSGVSWTLLVLLASPAVSLVLAFSTGLWGAWFLGLLAIVIWSQKRPYALDSIIIVTGNIAMGVIAPLLWGRLGQYQRDRILSFLNPSAQSQAAGYHVIQSQVAIGSGGWFGKGFTEGTQKRLHFLPEQHTDFIFPVIGEELGFIGVTIALALLCILLLRAVRIAMRAVDPFAGLVAFGLTAAWCVHVMVNVGMTVGLMPITGIPLPFFSYGGSFMLACWIGIGILFRISATGRGRADSFGI